MSTPTHVCIPSSCNDLHTHPVKHTRDKRESKSSAQMNEDFAGIRFVQKSKTICSGQVKTNAQISPAWMRSIRSWITVMTVVYVSNVFENASRNHREEKQLGNKQSQTLKLWIKVSRHRKPDKKRSRNFD